MRWRAHPCFLLLSGNHNHNHNHQLLTKRLPSPPLLRLQLQQRHPTPNRSTFRPDRLRMGNRKSTTLPMDAPNAAAEDAPKEMTVSDNINDNGAEEILPARKKGITWSKLTRCCADGEKEDDNEENYDETPDLDFIPSIGPCRSIEEASVNTTIEMGGPAAEEEEAELIIMQPEKKMTEITSRAASESGAEHTPPSDHHNVKIRLSPEEERIFRLFTNAAEAYESGKLLVDPNPTEKSVSARGGFTKQESATSGEGGGGGRTTTKSWLKPPPKVERIEIRVAGGWVRDKLLKQHSCDVDVALDCMMGVQFARIVQAYLALEQGREDEKKRKEEKEKVAVEGGGVNGDSSAMKAEAAAESESSPQKKGKNNKNSKQSKKQNAKDKEKTTKQPKIGVIGANPSQSKHLETATMNIHGIDVDFVNLRAEEVYESNSRIPTSKTRMFGTPLEDALRRDFTINSLFYNVRTHRIEDWTGRGLDDLLIHRKVVTPVNPHLTFHDDPLRVLRAVRFCVRLNFTLDDQIKEAAMSKRVHHSLHVKVSRERVGKELEGMLTGKHARPAVALDMIANLHLAGSVFAFPGSFPGDHDYAGGPVSGHILGEKYSCSLGTDSQHSIELAAKQRAVGWDESSNLLKVLPMAMEGHESEREKILSEMKDEKQKEDSLPTTVDVRLLHLCIFILPFHNLTFPDKKGKEVSVTAHMIKEALKFPVRDIQSVSKILSHVDEMAEILGEIRSQLMKMQEQQQEGGEMGAMKLAPPCRLRAGILLRSLKEHWVTCLLIAAAWEIRSNQKQQLDNKVEASPLPAATATTIPSEQPSRELYHAITSGLDLDECWKVGPHLNGKEMIKELSLPKGPIVGVYLEDQTKWMLLNPDGTREECMVHLRGCKKEREPAEVEGGAGGKTVAEEVNGGEANGPKTSKKKKKKKKKGASGGATEGHVSKKIRSEN